MYEMYLIHFRLISHLVRKFDCSLNAELSHSCLYSHLNSYSNFFFDLGPFTITFDFANDDEYEVERKVDFAFWELYNVY